MVTKRVEQLERGDIIVIVDSESSPAYRALITSIGQAKGSIPEDKAYDLSLVRIDRVAEHQHQFTAAGWMEHDAEFEVFELPPLGD